MKPIPFLDLAKETASLQSDIEAAVIDVVRSGRYLHGKATKAFESDLARQCGVREVIGVSNGLDALRLIFRAYIEMGRLKAGNEVIYPANTYIASILPLTEFGLKGIGVEPDPADFNLDWKKVLDAVTPRTRAVIAVHLYGNPCWNKKIADELHRRGILIIEDNAQGIGASAAEKGLHGVSTTGGLGDAAAFSFYPTKNIGALGDAGAVATNDPELAKVIRALANYGSDRRYHNIYCGYNCRIDEIQAAALSVKLRHLDEISSRRAKLARLYDALITNPAVMKPMVFDDRIQVWHQYVIRCKNRDDLRRFLTELGIATDIHYETPPHLQPCYSSTPPSHYPITETICNELISLPIAGLSEEDAMRIADTINRYEHQ